MTDRIKSIDFLVRKMCFTFFLLFSGFIQAHPVVVYPEGGEQFQAGQYITLQWEIAIEHEQEDWDLYFSHDGGLTWEPIVMDLNRDVLEYNWMLPDISTNRAHFRIVMDNVTGSTDYEDISNAFTILGGTDVTAIAGEPVPEFMLTTNPNPFRTQISIQFELNNGSDIIINVISASGIQVKTLAEGYFETGVHKLTWNAASAASGIYFCHLITPEEVLVRRMVLTR